MTLIRDIAPRSGATIPSSIRSLGLMVKKRNQVRKTRTPRYATQPFIGKPPRAGRGVEAGGRGVWVSVGAVKAC